SYSLVQWCAERGILLLHTPVGGSWLNLAESVQRILVRRALAGQHPQSVAELQGWLLATVRGWNADPTPFAWGGKRAVRRARAGGRAPPHAWPALAAAAPRRVRAAPPRRPVRWRARASRRSRARRPAARPGAEPPCPAPPGRARRSACPAARPRRAPPRPAPAP